MTHISPLPNIDESMFDLAPVSLWLEDYSAVRTLFERWRAEGVDDVVAHLRSQPQCMAEYGASIRVLKVNRRTLELFSAPDLQALQAALAQVFKGDMHEHALPEVEQLWSGANAFTNQTVNYALDGRRLDVHIRGRVLPGHEERWDRVLVSLEDNTAELQAQRRLRESENRARALFEHSPVSLWVEDFSQIRHLLGEVRAQGISDLRTFLKVHPEFVERCMREIRVLDVNRLTLQLFGAGSKEELLSLTHKVFRGEMRESFAEQLLDLWEGRLFQQREVVNYNLGGDALHIHMQFAVLQGHENDWSRVLLSLVDITARKKAEAYLEYLGKHDVLTSLRNRAFFVEELNRLARKGPWPVGVLAIDLNGLKALNDEEGHAAGDAMLRRAGEVLAKAVDEPACAARTGGDEFCILLPGGDERSARAMIERLLTLQELNNQFYPGQALSLSIGMAVAASGELLEAAVHQADQAMYARKNQYYAEQGLERRAS
ncbi:sensor domain-containing diguanylate cyclase [Melaminivora sp.]|uniref:sensor domain-containing diguanylate cyclase n=1 Tax=Melaminivora sp. TaxID=1933032 RepID=UPI0028AE30EA|nr:sensor domain-containing diguanylate cyclase [Melaminivora sp.]